jgi:hypothetical protein
MAYTDFYMQSTGNDLNAGSTSADTAVYTSTGGNWDGTSIFTPTDGSTPANSVNIGDWASIYPTGNTVSAYVAQVTAVGAGVNGTITLSTTAKFGTVPSVNSGSRNCKTGGAWASFATMPNLFVANTLTFSMRVNVKQATYTNTTNTRTNALSGTASFSLWFRGYNTTPGDCDTNPALTKPTVSFTTGQYLISGDFNITSNIIFTAAQTTNGTVRVSGATMNTFMRCRFSGTAANANSRAFFCGSFNVVFIACQFNVTSTTVTEMISTTGTMLLIDCSLNGAGTGAGTANGITTSGAVIVATGCVFNNIAAHCISFSGATLGFVCNNSYYNTGANGDALRSSSTAIVVSVNNIYANIGGYGVNSSAAASGKIVRSNNDSFSVTLGSANNVGDTPEFSPITDGSSPYNNAGSLDFSLAAITNARGGGAPGVGGATPGTFEGETYTSYLDNGAVQNPNTFPTPLGVLIMSGKLLGG